MFYIDLIIKLIDKLAVIYKRAILLILQI